MGKLCKLVFLVLLLAFVCSLFQSTQPATSSDTSAVAPFAQVLWPIGSPQDQGDTPYCVGYAWAEWLATVGLDYAGADVFHWAAAMSSPPGVNGTYLSNGGAALVQRHIIRSVQYTRSRAKLLDWLEHQGAVVAAIDWHQDMNAPILGHVTPTGSLVASHAVMCYGYLPYADEVTCQNTYGASYGNGGSFTILSTDLMSILTAGETLALPTR